MSETIVLLEAGFPSDEEAEEPALEAIKGMGVSLATGGMAETGADDGKPEHDADVDDGEEERLLLSISLRLRASCSRCSNSVCRPSWRRVRSEEEGEEEGEEEEGRRREQKQDD